MLLTFGWASVAVLALLGVLAIRRPDPSHPALIIVPAALAWAAVCITLAVHGG
jgi:hypothetical protein